MNTTLVRDKLDTFDYKLKSLQHKLDLARKTENKRQSLLRLQREGNLLVSDLNELLNLNKLLMVAIGEEEVSYKERRIGYVDDKITERLQHIFPQKSLVAQTDCDFKRFQTKLRLYLLDRNGYKRPPFVTEGKGAQQLISYTAAESSLSLLGKNKIYLDEAFSNASEQTQLKIQEILGKSVRDGFQVILIAHSPLIYQELPRREIHLESKSSEYVHDIVVVDYLDQIQEERGAFHE